LKSSTVTSADDVQKLIQKLYNPRILIIIKMGVLWGEKVDLDSQKLSYRMPAKAGEKRWFNAEFALNIAEDIMMHSPKPLSQGIERI